MRLGIIWFFLMVFAEIWSIIQVGDDIGALATLVLLVAGFIFGLQLMRSQGINALMQSAQQLQANGSPLAPLARALVKALAGILLIIPGFFSDAIALIILLPFVQRAFAGYLTKKSRFQGFAAGSFGGGGFNAMFGSGRDAHSDGASGNVYEHKGSVQRVDEESAPGRIIEHESDKKN